MRVEGRLTRRELLRLTAMAAAVSCLPGVSWALDSPSLASFMDLSRESTGFPQLDEDPGRRYFSALSLSEPRLAQVLHRWERGQREGWSQEQVALIDVVIECWYTGMMPTARGVEVVSFEAALGQACLPRRTPVTFCR